MKLNKYLPVMTMTALLMFSCSRDEISDPSDQSFLPDPPAAKIIEIETMQLINEYRISIGLQSLNNLGVIKSVAYSHTEYMLALNQLSHDNFEQRRRTLIDNAGAITVSENVGYGYTSGQAVLDAWLSSPSHRSIIEGNYTDFDISAEQNEIGVWFFTNIFIRK